MDTKASPTKNHTGSWIGWIGVVAFAIGLTTGFTEVKSCGSPFMPDSFGARLYDSMAGTNTTGRCAEDLASGTMFAWAFTVLGVVMIILGIVLQVILNRNVSSYPATQSMNPNVGERLHELEGLKSQGLLSEDEYAIKRKQLLDEL